jgi:hypothetical protein
MYEDSSTTHQMELTDTFLSSAPIHVQKSPLNVAGRTGYHMNHDKLEGPFASSSVL